MYSSFSLWTQASPSRGPALAFSRGMAARVFLVALSTILTCKDRLQLRLWMHALALSPKWSKGTRVGDLRVEKVQTSATISH